jgi:hypothetical protein
LTIRSERLSNQCQMKFDKPYPLKHCGPNHWPTNPVATYGVVRISRGKHEVHHSGTLCVSYSPPQRPACARGGAPAWRALRLTRHRPRPSCRCGQPSLQGTSTCVNISKICFCNMVKCMCIISLQFKLTTFKLGARTTSLHVVFGRLVV